MTQQIKDLWRKVWDLVTQYKAQHNVQTNQQKLYKVAFDCIGKDASPLDDAPDELGCADSVSRLIQKVLPDFPLQVGTIGLLEQLIDDPRFVEIDLYDYGCVIVSPTGQGNGRLSNGHTGIIGKNIAPNGTLWIMSNNSNTGTWEVDWTVKSWEKYYNQLGGFPIRIFKILG